VGGEVAKAIMPAAEVGEEADRVARQVPRRAPVLPASPEELGVELPRNSALM
jgi:hypothetical protein